MPQLMIPGRLIAAGDDGVLVAGNLLNDATSYLGGVEPYHYADYINNRMLYAGADVGTVADGTGYSFTRASEGYYENSDGTLTNFASGALRRGDRGVLIEGARTNLLLRSQEFDNASWSKTRASVTANAVTAPDGTTTADKLVESVDVGTHYVSQAFTGVDSTTYTNSVFVKAAERTWAWVVLTTQAGGLRGAYINLATGALGTVSGSTTASVEAFADGWYRVRVTADIGAAGSGEQVQVYAATADGTTSYTGDGTSGIYIWGAQLEAGAFPSSYIPTTSSSATRAADILSYTAGVSYPLSLWAEFERVVDTGSDAWITQLDNGTATERAAMRVSSAAALSGLSVAGGVQQSGETITGPIALNTVTTGATRIAANNVKLVLDGTLSSGDASATLPASPTMWRAGVDNSSGIFLWGYIRRLAIFNSALSDANLQTVTT
jgi:hypothetical protein